jgi:tRNA-specific 2-thiouridylase
MRFCPQPHYNAAPVQALYVFHVVLLPSNVAPWPCCPEGLDSMLAVRVIQEQGIEVEGINFYTGFCVEGHTHAIRKQDQNKQKRNNALWSAEMLGIRLNIEDISEEYKDVVLNPKHGYGAHLNPCLDCKIYMVNKAMGFVNRARALCRRPRL